MQQTRQGVISMKEKTQALQPASDGTSLNVPQVNYCGIYVKVKKIKNTIYTNQTGKFPITS